MISNQRKNFDSLKFKAAQKIERQVALVSSLCLGDLNELEDAEITDINEAIEAMTYHAETIERLVKQAKYNFANNS